MRDAIPGLYDPLGLRTSPLAVKAVAVLLGTALLTASSYVAVPLYPVPVTMQTFAITVIGALYGWRMGALTVLVWLGEAMIGMPVLAGGKFGLAPFVGPTAGYLFSFPLIAALTGWLVERGWDGKRPVLAFAAFLIANLLCLVIGGAWLAAMIGVGKGVALGVTPFIIGAFVKSGLGAVTLVGMKKWGRPRA